MKYISNWLRYLRWNRKPKRRFHPYPHLSRLEVIEHPEIILGKELTYEEKRDGSCMCLWLNDRNKVQISSRNQANACADLQVPIRKLPEFMNICELLKTELGRYILYGEYVLKKGGPTRIEGPQEEAKLIAFDIYDTREKNYIGYVQLYQMCYHYHIPVVERLGYATHMSMNSYYDFSQTILDWCKANKREGTVIKWVNSSPLGRERYLYFKEKIDIPPRPKFVKVDAGMPQYDPLPDSEVRGELSKMLADYGLEKMKDKATTMPEFAKNVSQAAKENLRRMPLKNLYTYYLEFLRENE